MKQVSLLLAVCLAAGVWVDAAAASHDEKLIEVIVLLTGASDAEELDDSVVERYSMMAEHPLKINRMTRSALLSCGLFNAFQVASFLDYRQRSGDVLSFTELGSIAGFDVMRVSLLENFVSLEPSDGFSSGGRHHYDNSLTAKVMPSLTGRTQTGLSSPSAKWSYGAKYNFKVDDVIEANISSSLAFSAAYYGRTTLGKVVVGDYNLRFGQGAVLWTGFSLSSVASTESVVRNPTGIVPYRSFSGAGTWRGAAVELDFGRWTLSMACSHPGKAAVNVMRLGRIWQIGATVYGAVVRVPGADSGTERPGFRAEAKVGLDARVCIKGVDVFGECAFDPVNLAPAALAGVRGRIAEKLTLAAVGRYYSPKYDGKTCGAIRTGTSCSDEGAFTLSMSFRDGMHEAQAYADCAWRPAAGGRVYRAGARYTCIPCPGLSLSLKTDYRNRDYGEGNRQALRLDVQWEHGSLRLKARGDVVHCTGWSFLGLISASYKHKYIGVTATQEFFRVDNWPDRIYSYQNDAPGNFTVSPCYGRGLRSSVYISSKPCRWLKLYLRTSTTQYPWRQAPGVKSDRLSTLSIRFQTVVDIDFLR